MQREGPNCQANNESQEQFAPNVERDVMNFQGLTEDPVRIAAIGDELGWSVEFGFNCCGALQSG